jgi:hypothetical protein
MCVKAQKLRQNQWLSNVKNEIIMKMTIHKKSMLAGLSVGAMALMLALPQAQANSINGSIGFAGTATPSGADLNTSTTIKNINSTVVSDTGTYAAIPLTGAGTPVPVTFPNLTVLGAGAGLASPLWTVDYSGVIYSFFSTAKTSEFDVAGSDFLEIGGNGYATISTGGYTPTDGTWILTVSQSGTGTHASFGFESTATVVGVPDGGMTLGLFGSVFLGLAGFRANFGAKRALIMA